MWTLTEISFIRKKTSACELERQWNWKMLTWSLSDSGHKCSSQGKIKCLMFVALNSYVKRLKGSQCVTCACVREWKSCDKLVLRRSSSNLFPRNVNYEPSRTKTFVKFFFTYLHFDDRDSSLKITTVQSQNVLNARLNMSTAVNWKYLIALILALMRCGTQNTLKLHFVFKSKWRMRQKKNSKIWQKHEIASGLLRLCACIYRKMSYSERDRFLFFYLFKIIKIIRVPEMCCFFILKEISSLFK